MTYLDLQLPIFVVALIANISLVAIVIQYAPKDRSKSFFSLFVLAQMLWITANFFAFSVPADYFLFVSRLTMFFATFHALFFFLFVTNFLPKAKISLKNIILPPFIAGIFVCAATLSPFVFTRLAADAYGHLAPRPGPLIGLFGAFVAFCVISGFYVMISRYKKADGGEKPQWKFLTIGFILTFILVLFFSFLNFIVFKNLSGVQFGHLYTLPFLAFTAYAMIKHKLLNIKAVVAEIMVIVLNSIIFIQLINSSTTIQFIISGLVLIGTLVVGILLIKGIEKEVQQREQLQILTRQLEAANKQLIVLDQARAEFISIASHQLRTPPATVKWYLAALLSGDYGEIPPGLKAILEKTQRANNSLISLIDDMLNVSRIERGKMEFLFEETDLAQLAQITFEQLQPMAHEKNLELSYSPPPAALPKIMADREKLRQVMNNLIDNAIKYTRQGSIVAELLRDGDSLRFQVTDSGKGIAPEEKNEIFGKFSRGKESIKQSAGLGLGLYVAKVIVEQHKGKIWAESAGAGKGSKFIFTVPIHNDLSKTTLFDLTQNQAPPAGK